MECRESANSHLEQKSDIKSEAINSPISRNNFEGFMENYVGLIPRFGIGLSLAGLFWEGYQIYEKIINNKPIDISNIIWGATFATTLYISELCNMAYQREMKFIQEEENERTSTR